MNDIMRLAIIAGTFVLGVIGWIAGGYVGVAIGLAIGLGLLVVPWRGLPLRSWLDLYLRRNRKIELAEPLTVANDRSGGGVRYQDDVAIAAVHILGKQHQPTYFTGSTATLTADTVEISELFGLMRQSLGLTMESMSLITVGARRRATGDYPRVYDTLLGTPPYAGQRETWLVLRIRAMDNGDALRLRSTVGTATLAAAQRIAAALRCRGIRARVATATDIVELERRVGRAGLEPHNRRWNSVRGDGGWLTTYAYRPPDVTTENLAQAWSLRVDGIVQNITLYPDATASATVTVRTAQPPTAPPAVLLKPLVGEQPQALASAMCCPRPELRGVLRGPLRGPVVMPIGPSGILLGKTLGGDRLLLPLGDPGEQSRVHIAAEDAIAKRLIIRAAGAGDRITVHTTNLGRWESVRMPHIAVIEHPRPAAGTTISVTDGTVPPAPRPATVISVVPPGTPPRTPSDVVVTQTGPATIAVIAAGERYDAEVEFFRAENRYITREVIGFGAELEMAD
jgi:type VII secretion protein EccE